MSSVPRPRATTALALFAAALAAALALLPGPAAATGLPDDGGAEWQVEQPLPPPGPGVETEVPVSLGHIGDIEFYAPNRGALITSGNGGSVKPGVWFYDGASWHEAASECGATDGRIVWTGPDEFWTISDTRPGGASASGTQRPPTEDNTLCRFAPSAAPNPKLEIADSYGSVPFLGSSYQPMHAAACLTAQDCWFAGGPLPPPQVGIFMLHWNGATLEPEPYLTESHALWSMQPFGGLFYASLLLEEGDNRGAAEGAPPPLLKGPITSHETTGFEPLPVALLYREREAVYRLDYLRLSVAGEAIWAGAGPQEPAGTGPEEAGVTIARKTKESGWRPVIAPVEGENEAEPPPGARLFHGEGGETDPDVLTALAAEPGTTSAWIGVESGSDAKVEDAHEFNHAARATLARVSSEGTVSDRLELPLPEDTLHGPLGDVQRIVCPAQHDCWATTAAGWLLHLSTEGERHSEPLADPVFAEIEAGTPIAFRPPDQGVPAENPDTIPADPNEIESTRNEEVIKAPVREPAKVPVPLLTHVHTRVIHRTTLVLSFHLAVVAKVQLLAERKRKVVARTAQHTLKAGNRSLQLQLDPKRWPTHLNLKTHALAPLPTQTTASPNVGSISTSLVAPARLLSAGLVF